MLSFVRQLRQQNIFTFGQMRAGDEDGEQAFCNLLTIASFLDTVLFQLYLHRVLHVMHIFTQSYLHYDVIYLNPVVAAACRPLILPLFWITLDKEPYYLGVSAVSSVSACHRPTIEVHRLMGLQFSLCLASLD